MPSIPPEVIAEVLAGYDLEPGRVRAVRKVLQVDTAAGPVCLKRVKDKYTTGNAWYVAQATEHLLQAGCTRLPRILLTRQGGPVYVHAGRPWQVQAWLPGSKPDLSDPAVLAETARALADFHARSLGFRHRPPAIPAYRGGKLLEEFARKLRRLELLEAEAKRVFGKATAGLLHQAQAALARLEASSYLELYADAHARGLLCHGDVLARNFLKGPAGKVYLIDLDRCFVEAPCADIWDLCYRGVKKRRAAAAVGTAVTAYACVRPLSQGERHVLAALLSWPRKGLKVIFACLRRKERRSRRGWEQELNRAISFNIPLTKVDSLVL